MSQKQSPADNYLFKVNHGKTRTMCETYQKLRIKIPNKVIGVGPVSLLLKELRNCILRNIRVWSLFCSVRVYISLYFLPILLEN